MPFLPPNRQCQSTEGQLSLKMKSEFIDIATASVKKWIILKWPLARRKAASGSGAVQRMWAWQRGRSDVDPCLTAVFSSAELLLVAGRSQCWRDACRIRSCHAYCARNSDLSSMICRLVPTYSNPSSEYSSTSFSYRYRSIVYSCIHHPHTHTPTHTPS